MNDDLLDRLKDAEEYFTYKLDERYYAEVCYRAAERIKELENPWISDRLPKEAGTYLITAGPNWHEIEYFNGNKWPGYGNIITHWMIIPPIEAK